MRANYVSGADNQSQAELLTAELLNGDNQYHCEFCARKVRSLPYILPRDVACPKGGTKTSLGKNNPVWSRLRKGIVVLWH